MPPLPGGPCVCESVCVSLRERERERERETIHLASGLAETSALGQGGGVNSNRSVLSNQVRVNTDSFSVSVVR